MGKGKERPPAFELDAAADAEQIQFLVPGRTDTRSEGVALVEHKGQRSGLPDRVRPDACYTAVHASFRVAAWLEDADG
ncbi:MAG: hypothetical protein ACTHJW_10750 [Streptosporangiaceae bacterium]